jgi:glycerol uptake facilitator-like aquaporin
MVEENSLQRRLLAEFLGSLILVFTAISPIILGFNVLKSGIAIAVLMDAIAVGFVLFVLIEILEPISYCHINPAVTIAMIFSKNIEIRTGLLYIIVQIVGGICGTIASHAMFIGHDFFQWMAISTVARDGGSYFAEFMGTFTLVLVIFGCIYKKTTRPGLIIGFLVGGFLITTSSTMFANPQVTIARIFTWAAAGVRPIDAAVFVVVQIAAAIAATGVASFLFPQTETSG